MVPDISPQWGLLRLSEPGCLATVETKAYRVTRKPPRTRVGHGQPSSFGVSCMRPGSAGPHGRITRLPSPYGPRATLVQGPMGDAVGL